MLDHIPEQVVKSSNSQELKIELINGSIIQLIAADEFSKSGVGTNPQGVVFSEYSILKSILSSSGFCMPDERKRVPVLLVVRFTTATSVLSAKIEHWMY
jgi:hypothetical protein